MTDKTTDTTCSCVSDVGGLPTLFVNGEPVPAAAYMTYLEERNDYAAFAEAGYRLFSVPVLFSGRWINAGIDCKPFHDGIFDRKDDPDYSSLDESVRRVLSVCPDAYVFPRLNLSMPLWWIRENPTQTDGTGRRESLFSLLYRNNITQMLLAVIRHISESDYAPRIIGYQLAGGNTEEWFHFDLNGGYCKNTENAFQDYLRQNALDGDISGQPDLSLLQSEGPYHEDDLLALYLEFANRSVAELICSLCGAVKKETKGRLVIGTFYGYSLEVSSPLWGTHALKTILGCKNVDFLCSPNSYIGTRDVNLDWTEMYPADSVRLHGKLCMQECDVRTHLTKPLCEAAPEYDPENRYTAPIWQGLADRSQSLNMIRKSFGRQLVKGNGFWWFDMWGGWYHDPALLTELNHLRKIYTDSLTKKDRKSLAELAVFVDESAYRYMTDCALRSAAFVQRGPLGHFGAPYDAYDVSDFPSVFQKYKAVLFLSACKTGYMRRALRLCAAYDVPYLSITESKTWYTAQELRDFCDKTGVHIYSRTNDLLYVNKNYLVLHASEAGEKAIVFKETYSYRELLTEKGSVDSGTILKAFMQAGETKLFELYTNH